MSHNIVGAILAVAGMVFIGTLVDLAGRIKARKEALKLFASLRPIGTGVLAKRKESERQAVIGAERERLWPRKGAL